MKDPERRRKRLLGDRNTYSVQSGQLLRHVSGREVHEAALVLLVG